MLKRVALTSAGLLAAGAVVVPAGAHAASGTSCQVTGTMLEEGPLNIQSDTFAGNNEIFRLTHPILLNGGITGTAFDQEFAWGSGITGAFTSHDIVTFDFSLGDPYTPATITCGGTSLTGGLKINFLATGSDTFTAHFQIVGSSGDLAGTTGDGTMSGVPGFEGGNGTYVATLQLP